MCIQHRTLATARACLTDRLLDGCLDRVCLGLNSVDEGMLAHADIKWRTAILVRGALVEGLGIAPDLVCRDG